MKALRNFLIKNHYEYIQAFDTRNIVGDRMVTVYQAGGITVDYCPDYNYLEIFGLTDEQFCSLWDILDI